MSKNLFNQEKLKMLMSEIILNIKNSSCSDDLLKKLITHFPDWSVDRISEVFVKPRGATFSTEQASNFLTSQLGEGISEKNVLELCCKSEKFHAYVDTGSNTHTYRSIPVAFDF